MGEVVGEEDFRVSRDAPQRSLRSARGKPPSLSLPGEWVTGCIVAARPNVLRRHSELGGDDRLHRRPGTLERLAGGGGMIAVRDG